MKITCMSGSAAQRKHRLLNENVRYNTSPYEVLIKESGEAPSPPQKTQAIVITLSRTP